MDLMVIDLMVIDLMVIYLMVIDDMVKLCLTCTFNTFFSLIGKNQFHID